MKKGMISGSALLTLILLVVVMIVLFPFIKDVASYLFGRGNLEVCRASVATADALRIAGQSVTPIKCPMEEREVKMKDVETSGVVDPQKVLGYVAEELRTCWWKMGEGKAEPFPNEYLGNEHYCVICSKVTFDDKVIKKAGSNLEVVGINGYLGNTTMPGQEIDQNQLTYIDYMSKTVEGKKWRFFIPVADDFTIWTSRAETFEPLDSIWLNEDYLVVYSLVPRSAIDSIPFIGGWMTKVAVILPETKAVPFITYAKVEDLNELNCDNVFQ